jgi:hypothetical protein
LFVGSPNVDGEYYSDGVRDASKATLITLGSSGSLYATPTVGEHAGVPLIANVNPAANPAVIFWTPLWKITSSTRAGLTCTLDETATPPTLACQVASLISFSYFPAVNALSIRSGTGNMAWRPTNLGCAAVEPVSPVSQPPTTPAAVLQQCDHIDFKIQFLQSSWAPNYATTVRYLYMGSATSDFIAAPQILSKTSVIASAAVFTLDPLGQLWQNGFIAVTYAADALVFNVAPAIYFMSTSDWQLVGAIPITCQISNGAISTLTCFAGGNPALNVLNIGTGYKVTTSAVGLGTTVFPGQELGGLKVVGAGCSTYAPVPR